RPPVYLIYSTTSALFIFSLRYPLFTSLYLFNPPPPTEIYTLSLHDALPISEHAGVGIDIRLPGDPVVLAVDRSRVDNRITRQAEDRKSTRLNSSHDQISYAVFCLKKKKKKM